MRTLQSRIGKLALKALTPQHLQLLYAAKLDAGLSTSSVNGIHVVLHRALKQALKWGLVARNVADPVEAPRPKHQKAEGLQAAESPVFLQCAHAVADSQAASAEAIFGGIDTQKLRSCMSLSCGSRPVGVPADPRPLLQRYPRRRH